MLIEYIFDIGNFDTGYNFDIGNIDNWIILQKDLWWINLTIYHF